MYVNNYQHLPHSKRTYPNDVNFDIGIFLRLLFMPEELLTISFTQTRTCEKTLEKPPTSYETTLHPLLSAHRNQKSFYVYHYVHKSICFGLTSNENFEEVERKSLPFTYP